MSGETVERVINGRRCRIHPDGSVSVNQYAESDPHPLGAFIPIDERLAVGFDDGYVDQRRWIGAEKRQLL